MNYFTELKKTVIDNGYCIGCGACAFDSKNIIKIEKDEYGKLKAFLNDNIDLNLNFDTYKNTVNVLNVCPFYNNDYDENKISYDLFSNINRIKYNEFSGYYLNTYSGYIKSNIYRNIGSSGGFGSWIACKLLEGKHVDKIIHVKSTDRNGILFDYQISSTINEVIMGAKSKYYPIELSKILEYVLNNDCKYALFGLPCYIKAVRKMQKQYPVLKDRIIFTIGLVCGHLKSDFFAKSIAWDLGIHPNELTDIDFRVKNPDQSANNYSVKISGYRNKSLTEVISSTNKLFVTNWGLGFFKYKACDFCDDVLAETADITIGDAWLPKYNNDYLGTNIIIIRNETIDAIFNNYKDEIVLENITNDDIYQSQAGGFRHRREGLKYRLYLCDKKQIWRPQKRISATNKIPNIRKRIYITRMRISEKSFDAYIKALKKNSFDIFKKSMNHLLIKYYRINNKNRFMDRVINYLKRVFNF